MYGHLLFCLICFAMNIKIGNVAKFVRVRGDKRNEILNLLKLLTN